MNALESPLEAVALNNYVSVGLLVNNIWTWVAVLTAAVSFWSIRVVATDLAKSSDQIVRCGKPDDHHVSESESDQPNYKATTTTTIITTLPDHQKKPDTRAASNSNSNSVSSTTNMMMRSSLSLSLSLSSWCVEPTIESNSSIELGGATRGRKFSVYYYKGKGKGKGDELGGIDDCTSGTGGDYDDIIIDEYDDEEEEEEEEEGNWEFWDKMLKTRMGEMELGWYRYQDLTLLDGNVVRLWDSST